MLRLTEKLQKFVDDNDIKIKEYELCTSDEKYYSYQYGLCEDESKLMPADNLISELETLMAAQEQEEQETKGEYVMKKFAVTLTVNAYYTPIIEAKDEDEAEEKAYEMIHQKDFMKDHYTDFELDNEIAINSINTTTASRITNAHCEYTGGGVWIYWAKYGPVWLEGTLDQYINAYDIEPRPFDTDDAEEWTCEEQEAHMCDEFVDMPTWQDIAESIRNMKGFANADECISIINEWSHLDDPCNE